MEVIRAASEKLDAALSLTERLAVGTFPYPHAESVLGEITELLRAAKGRLDPNAHPSVLHNECNLITNMLDEFLPLLGFLYRSRSSANAFELYGPLLRLVRRLVDGRSRLILASEWQFSPFTYLGVPGLTDVVWVGLPASESSNALLTPLAGHEFGHHLWSKQRTIRRRGTVFSIELRRIGKVTAGDSPKHRRRLKTYSAMPSRSNGGTFPSNGRYASAKRYSAT